MPIDTTRSEALRSTSEIDSIVRQNIGASLTDTERSQALQAAKSLVASLEKPRDALMLLGYTPSVWMSMRICVELNVFSILSRKEETSARELAEETGADENLLVRLLRVLAASNYVAERGLGGYGPTKWTEQLCDRNIECMEYVNLSPLTLNNRYDTYMPLATRTPQWFKERGYRNPTNPKDGIFQYTFDSGEDGYFQWISRPENKRYWDDANGFFECDRANLPSWVSWFPVREKLLPHENGCTSAAEGEVPLLVDVGGGRGQDILEFQQEFPDVSGRLVLQDQQFVLDGTTSLSSRVEKYSIDFFKESPVKGARIYFMKFVLHDYQDEQCLRILENIKASMREGYSYLVINEFIIPSTGCTRFPAQFDLLMMMALTSLERTEIEWTFLLERAGLALEGLYQPPCEGQGIIVATLPCST